MAEVDPARNNIHEESVRYESAVSESTWFRIAGSINFVNEYQNKIFKFGPLGSFGNSTETLPLEIGSEEAFEFSSEITHVIVNFGNSGSSGTTEVDIEWSDLTGAVWASIFSTPPAVSNTATDYGIFDSAGIFTTPAGCTAPVLSKTTFALGDRLRAKLVTKAADAKDFDITIHFRPI